MKGEVYFIDMSEEVRTKARDEMIEKYPDEAKEQFGSKLLFIVDDFEINTWDEKTLMINGRIIQDEDEIGSVALWLPIREIFESKAFWETLEKYVESEKMMLKLAKTLLNAKDMEVKKK